jgi:hypothetical protein
MLRRGIRLDEILDDTLQLIDLHLASIRNTFLRCELGTIFLTFIILKLLLIFFLSS